MPPKEELANLGEESQMEGLPPQDLKVIFTTSVALFLSLLKLNTTMFALKYFVDSW